MKPNTRHARQTERRLVRALGRARAADSWGGSSVRGYEQSAAEAEAALRAFRAKLAEKRRAK